MSYPPSINYASMASVVIVALGEDVQFVTSTGVKTDTRAIISESLETFTDAFDTQTRDERMEATLLRADVPKVVPGDYIHTETRVYIVVIVDESDDDVFKCLVSVA